MNTPTTPSSASVAVAQNQYTPTLPTGGWEGFYNQLTSAGNIPNLQVTSFSPDNINAVFRGVYIKMSAIQAQLQRQETVSGVTYDICTVYTDVLNIDTQINWALANTALVIYARVIETAAGGGLTINMDFSASNSATSLMVFSSSISGTILVNANGKAYTTITNGECVTGLGINYNSTTNAPATSTLQLYNGIPVGQ
ncbi:MAG: hypothetical protein IT236_16400, partial [Bacteroidia bacterium]|nr:hypothetical protein [Bacteroidia bacterium]